MRADAVRTMLGLSDRGAIRDLFGLLLEGKAPEALAALRGQYDLGVDPQAVLRTLLETVHGTTLAKLGTEAQCGPVGGGIEGARALGGGAVLPRAPPAVAAIAQGA